MASTLKALTFMYVVETRAQLGAPVDVGGPVNAPPPPFVSEDSVYGYIIGLLDSAQADLGRATALSASFPFPSHRAEPPDERLDAAARAREQARRRRRQLRTRGVGEQVVQRRLVRVGDVEVAAPGPHTQGEQAGRDREASRAHGQNPAWMVKKNCREGGYGPRSMLRVIDWAP